MNPDQIFVKPFAELTTKQLYDIYKLRCDVFVVEQNCAYPEIDDLDLLAFHLCLYDNGVLLTYCRIIPPHTHRVETVIGRVVTPQSERSKGYSKMMIGRAISWIKANYPNERNIFIMAQYHLKAFYASFSFVQTSEVFLEDGIEHINMLLDLEQKS